ncbi:MAG: hypothetical protein U5L96_19840 [Owenweeksia sp.]|nr:hypothetical protein [Owenweeksia sp.]
MQPYTLYDAPEYKLQVGDFRTRLDAERFLRERIVISGSGSVVKTNIKPPQLEKTIMEWPTSELCHSHKPAAADFVVPCYSTNLSSINI